MPKICKGSKKCLMESIYDNAAYLDLKSIKNYGAISSG